MSERTCVYDIVLKGEVVYVGVAKNPETRLRAHRRSGVAPEGSKMVVYRWLDSRPHAMRLERERQAELRPAFCRDAWLQQRKPRGAKAYAESKFDWPAWVAERDRLIAGADEDAIEAAILHMQECREQAQKLRESTDCTELDRFVDAAIDSRTDDAEQLRAMGADAAGKVLARRFKEHEAMMEDAGRSKKRSTKKRAVKKVARKRAGKR